MLRTCLILLQLLRRDQRGVISVEIGLISTMLLLLMIPMMDFGFILHRAMQLSSSLRAGMQYAILYPNDTAGITQRIRNSSGLTSATVTTTTTCECDSVSASCASACAGTLATFLTISTTYNQPLFLSTSLLTNPYPITRQITLRTD